jgi:hypothetical protein
MHALFASVAAARRTGTLALAASVGLTTARTAGATSVRANTFYGAP